MELPEIVEFARNFAVMVRIQGPDPKGLKMRKHAFHHYQFGKTTLSASGLLLPGSLSDFPIGKRIQGQGGTEHSSGSAIVVTVASIVEPFLSVQRRENSIEAVPELIKGAQVDVMIEGKGKALDNVDHEPDKGAPCWLQSKLLALVDVPVSSQSLQSLIEAPSGSPEHGSWEVGWSLASLANGDPSFSDALQPQAGRDTRTLLERNQLLRESRNPHHMATSTTRIAFLTVSTINSQDLPNVRISPPNKRGDLLLAMGSPFGVLSPVHFLNSISVGSVANLYPSSSGNSSLLMADIRCLPGMEGSPVFGEHAQLIGILSRPLRQRVGGAEIQLVIPWLAVKAAWYGKMLNEHKKTREVDYIKENISALQDIRLSKCADYNADPNFDSQHPSSHSPRSWPIDKAMSSITLITINDGAWASGVLLNNEGLILTNAHLLEPWRFGKTTVYAESDQSMSVGMSIISQEAVSGQHDERCKGEEKKEMLPKMVKILGTSVAEECSGSMGSIYKTSKRIRVRLNHTDPWIWCDARVVYVSKGPLDVALLQLESVPDQLFPIVPDFSCPSPGSKAHVIGHGLFGPRCDVFPSVCSGVVARVVKAQRLIHINEPCKVKSTKRCIPAMLETTAAVHPGGSGGAVVNSDGCMIGLVTSNARHGGGTVIPHLNFSIPCAALEPIFKFSKDMQDLSILHWLDEPNEHLSSVWALMPPLSPKPVPLPKFLDLPVPPTEANTKSGKGSRFAKFISEKHGDMFPQPNRLVKVDKLSNETIQSKL